ncbi:hypothetical protein GCK72_009452 [Caenorhabditis remanei]|uniref:3'-5' exonuclease domain-containing protein n=1 Tax=Caenorhabditis remanei TaxID=31234 RepID=A0A6A5H0F3_CAERE|nr:hypothetical protein GCK72_009452 [Caenorhabditis remanei]KAF1761198.1 hypothetical protein GCK72_009452 [Caenorhabditis remanei]
MSHVQESTSSDSTQEKQFFNAQRQLKYKTLDDRAKIVKEIMKSEEGDRKEKLRLTFFEFFDEDFRKSRNITSEHEEECQYETNVYEMMILFISSIPDRKKEAGKNVTQWFLESFMNWISSRNIGEELKNTQLTERTKESSKKCCVREPAFSDSLRKIFDYSEDDILDKRERMIKEMFENQQYKEASELIIKHGLVDEYTFEQLVLPLILCDKCQIVDELLKLSPRFQKDYLKFLDGFVGKTDEVVDSFFKPYEQKGMVKINLNRFHGKSLTTFIQKFFNGIAKQCHFDVDERRDTPFFEAYMKGKALKYYCMQRFELKVMADELYFEHTKNTLKQSPIDTVFYYFGLLWDSGFVERRIEALFWIRYLNIPTNTHQLPYGIGQFYRNPDPKLTAEVERLLALRTEIPQTEITEQLFVYEKEQKCPITIVKNGEELEELCRELDTVEEGTYIGYDSEFKPGHLTDSSISRMATIQLFFNEKVFLVDCVILEKIDISEGMWKKFFESLFHSKKLTVIGFDMKNDMEALFTVRPIRDDFRQEDVKNFICVKRFVEILNEYDASILSLTKKSCRLITLVEELLNLTMDKTEQTGNWQCRPLRKNQIVYASLDAVIVLDLFRKIFEIVKQYEKQVEIDKLLDESRSFVTVKKEKVKKETKVLTASPWENMYEILRVHRDPTKPLQRPSELKIIVDTMVLGTGKNLRLLGIDVFIPRDASELQKYLLGMKTFANEQRSIVTVPSKSYEAMKAENPNAHFILLQDVYNKQWLDLVTDFLDQFNLDIRKEDGLKRK